MTLHNKRLIFLELCRDIQRYLENGEGPNYNVELASFYIRIGEIMIAILKYLESEEFTYVIEPRIGYEYRSNIPRIYKQGRIRVRNMPPFG